MYRSRDFLHLTVPFLLAGSLAACGGDDAPADSAEDTGDADGTTTSSSDEAGDEGMCQVGTEGCPCTLDGICEEGLSCVDGICEQGGSGACGDGFLDPGEECDQGSLNADDWICTSACQIQVCGDGLLGPGESCDDANDVDDDECSNACVLPSCGDGVAQTGEECDDGNGLNGDECTNACTAAACGDGFVQVGEEACDDGNMDDTDGCTTACEFSPKCGDGVQVEGELCFAEEVLIAVPMEPGQSVSALGMGDIDGDDDPDVVVCLSTADTEQGAFAGFTNDGSGNLVLTQQLPSMPLPDGGGGAQLAFTYIGRDCDELLVANVSGGPEADLIVGDRQAPGVDILIGHNEGVRVLVDAFTPNVESTAPSTFTDGVIALALGNTDNDEQLEVAALQIANDGDFFVEGIDPTEGPTQAPLEFWTFGLSLYGTPLSPEGIVGGSSALGNFLPGVTTQQLAFTADRKLWLVDVTEKQTAGDNTGLVFLASYDTPTDVIPGRVAVADFNGDGLDDVVAVGSYQGGSNGSGCADSGATGGILLWLTTEEAIDNTSPGWLMTEASVVPGSGCRVADVVTGDFNNDGLADFAAKTIGQNLYEPTVLAVSLGNGDGTFQPAVNITTKDPASLRLEAGDLNGDGIDDPVALNILTNSFSVFLSNP